LILGVALVGPAGLGLRQALCGVAQAAESQSSGFAHPVRGEIIRHYEEPPGPYASGHRGIDYGVASGTPVHASNDGKVSFAGPVAGEGLFITLAHADGIETTYSFLSSVAVKALDQVIKGQQIGLSGAGHPGEGRDALHFGMKQNGQYINPEPLLQDDDNDVSNAIGLAPTDEQGSNENPPSRSSPPGSYSGGSAAGQPGYFSGGKGFETDPSKGGGYTTEPPSGRGYGTNPPRGQGYGTNPPRGQGYETRPPGGASGTAPAAAKTYGTGGPGGGGMAGGDDFVNSFYGASPKGSTISTEWKRLGRFLADDYKPGGPGAVGVGPKPSHPNGLGGLARANSTRTWLAKQFDRVGTFFDPPPSWSFDPIAGPIGGLFHQIGCELKGGAKPPAMPTTEELDSHSSKAPPAPNKNVVVVIGGLNSNSTQEKNGEIKGHSSMFDTDMRTLGYKPNQIYHYSYKGIEQRGGTGPYKIHALYQKEDTYKRIEASSKLLAKQIREIHRQNPGRKIDLVAHSEGGLVADYFIENFFDKGNPKQAQIDHFITVDTPHEGADLARTQPLFSDTATGRTVRPIVQWPLSTLFGAPPASAPVLGEVQEDSTFIRDLKAHWDPNKVRTTTIGAALDAVVTATHTRLPGDDHYTTDIPSHLVPFTSHGLAPTAPTTKGIIYNALAGRPSKCTAFRDAVAEHVTGPAIAGIEDGLVAGAHWTFRASDFSASMGDSSGSPRFEQAGR